MSTVQTHKIHKTRYAETRISVQASNVRHHKVGESGEGAVYRIKDEVEYSLDIQEWDGTKWAPYVADDVQLHFFLMSPYVKKTLTSDKEVGHPPRFVVSLAVTLASYAFLSWNLSREGRLFSNRIHYDLMPPLTASLKCLTKRG